MPTINVVIGPPCAGKSTLAWGKRSPDDVIVDADKIAHALGSMLSHGSSGSIKKLTQRVRQSAINGVLDGIEHDAWIIHTRPGDLAIRRYIEAGAVFRLVDPGLEECLERARRDGRPEGTEQVIRDWHHSPPDLDPVSSEKRVSFMAYR